MASKPEDQPENAKAEKAEKNEAMGCNGYPPLTDVSLRNIPGSVQTDQPPLAIQPRPTRSGVRSFFSRFKRVGPPRASVASSSNAPHEAPETTSPKTTSAPEAAVKTSDSEVVPKTSAPNTPMTEAEIEAAIEAERQEQIKFRLRIGYSPEKAKDIPIWQLGPNKYSGPEFEAAKEKSIQERLALGWPEEDARKIAWLFVGMDQKYCVPPGPERDRVRARMKKAREEAHDWV
ncbi:hypothetical protein TWF696_006192 [Orbilia brochopaga]|uniref:Uncharacterized protein n=1 Tax=Orbilia brochopaga TaxID=3140254 RepID=A0AAV9UWQ9_9PEZI